MDGRIVGAALIALATVMSGCSSDDACSEPGAACTWAGVVGPHGAGDDGLDRRDTQLDWPMDLSFGPDGTPWIVDWNDHRVLRVAEDQTVHTAIGVSKQEGDGDPELHEMLPLGDPPGAPGVQVSLNHPSDIDFMPDGTLILASWHTNKIRAYDPETELVKVVAGSGYGYEGDGGPAYQAVLNQPKAVATDRTGRMYIADQLNQRIRTIEPDGEREVGTLVGVGTRGYSGDGGPAIDAELAFTFDGLPGGAVAVDDDYLYLADSGNNRIRRVELATGMIDCIAGNGGRGYSGDGGPAIDAELDYPVDIELGPDGRLYVADSGNSVIRAIDLETGVIEHVAGTGAACADPSSGECHELEEVVTAAEVTFSMPYGVAFDGAGDLYIADTYNNRIVKITR